ncbi:MAG: hypothetical protein WDO56_24810 [Gammaproteobacteria bacterium]
MKRVVEEAADAGAAQPERLGFEIQHVPEQSRFPMKLPVTPGIFRHRLLELRQHGEREARVAREPLMTVEHP